MKYWQAEQLKKYLGPHSWHQLICIQFLEEEFAFLALRNRCVPAEFFAPINNLARTQQQLPQEINRKKREDLRAELGFYVTERCLRDWMVRVLSVVALASQLLQRHKMNSTNWFCLLSETWAWFFLRIGNNHLKTVTTPDVPPCRLGV